jgi:hypothetical protein
MATNSDVTTFVDDVDDVDDDDVDDDFNCHIRTACPRMLDPDAIPALVVTTLRTTSLVAAPSSSSSSSSSSSRGGRPATDTVFSCPSNVHKHALVRRHHIRAVPSQLPLTNHGWSSASSLLSLFDDRGGSSIHDRLVTALACPSNVITNS